jgi:ABC-type transport system involved in multi-copper enzyme maturation permease subunit
VTARVYAIVLNTFREAIRNKILYGILAAVVLWNAFAMVLGAMSLSEEARIARDVGLAGVSLFGAVTAIVLGVSLLYTEIQKRTIHVVLAKPIWRHEFVLGKYLGMAVTLTLLVAAFAAALAGLLGAADVPFDANVAKAVTLGWLEVMLVAAIAVFFSSFSTPFLSGLFTFALFFIGRSSKELEYAANKAKDPVLSAIGKAALYVVPDLHIFQISGSEVGGKAVSVHASFVGWDYVGQAALYAGAVIGILLILAVLIFSRRDFA